MAHQADWYSVYRKVNSPDGDKSFPKILIVDDESNIGNMLQDTLEQFQFETAFAEDKETAIRLMKEIKPAIALVDVRFGNVDGIELSKLLREIDPHLPVILMTAYPSVELAASMAQADIYDFVSKPVDKAYLLQSIWKGIKKRNLSEENKQLILYLKASNAALSRLNDLKSKFLSIVTHDLRGPLTTFLGYVDLLESTPDLPPEKRDRSFETLRRSIKQMNHLISNLMDMVGIESDKLRVEMYPMDYVGFCDHSRDAFLQIAATRKVTLDWQLPEMPMMIMADHHRLQQLLTNLISNAFKHVRKEGKITLRVSQKDNMVLTEIIDNGEGIAAEHQSRIFEHFYQVEDSSSVKQGLGLGLYISQEIVHSHKGQIGVFSEGRNMGTTFWYTLPLMQHDALPSG